MKCKLIYTKGGANSRDLHSINWEASGYPVRGSDDLETILTNSANALKPLLTTDMTILRATASEKVEPGVGPRKVPVSLEFKNLKGTLAIPNGGRTSSLDHVLIFTKNIALGVDGKIEIRGAVLESEVDTSTAGELAFTGGTVPARIATFATAFFNATCPSPTQSMIMPTLNEGGTRYVKSIQFEKLGLSQLTINHVKPEKTLDKALKGMMSELNTEYVDAKYSRRTGATNTLSDAQIAVFNAEAKAILKLGNINRLGKIGIPKPIQELMKTNAA